jgi:hypothetical protein
MNRNKWVLALSLLFVTASASAHDSRNFSCEFRTKGKSVGMCTATFTLTQVQASEVQLLVRCEGTGELYKGPATDNYDSSTGYTTLAPVAPHAPYPAVTVAPGDSFVHAVLHTGVLEVPGFCKATPVVPELN